MSLDINLYGEENSFYTNITHNLQIMACECGIHDCLWEQEKSGITKAIHLREHLEKAILKLIKNPSYFRTFNATNGWGRYEDFLLILVDLLEFCVMNPEARIETRG